MCGFIKEWIENWKEDKNRNSEIENPGNMSDLLKIVAMKDPKYVKEFIEYNEEILKECHINGDRAVDLIKTVGDPEYIKECLENVEKMQALYINGDRAVNLIKETGDSEYIKEKWLENVKKMQALGIEGRNAVILIKATKDIEYIKKLLKNKEKTKALNIQDFHAIELIRTVEEKEPGYIKKYIKKHIKNGKVNELESDFLIQVIIMTADAKFIDYCKDSGVLNHKTIERLDRFTKMPPVTLPDKMTIGVEIESEGPCNWENIRETIDEAELDWVAKDDGSLQNGTEVASTILTESTASMEIFKICQELRRLRQTTSKRCGGHIHIGADYLTDIQDWRNLRTIWNNAEGIFYAISNAKGEIPRQGVIEYASPISKKDETFSETINLDSEDDLEKYIKLLKEIQGSKYSGINYRNVGSSGKNTIEFRLPNGTINPTTWVENINLFGGLIRTSHELSKIMKKTEEQRTEEEKQMLYNYEILQTETDEKKDAEALIKLCVLPEQVKTYLERYNVNSKLLKYSPKIYKGLKERISTKKLDKKYLQEKNGVNGADCKQVASELDGILKERGEQNVK